MFLLFTNVKLKKMITPTKEAIQKWIKESAGMELSKVRIKTEVIETETRYNELYAASDGSYSHYEHCLFWRLRSNHKEAVYYPMREGLFEEVQKSFEPSTHLGGAK